MKLSSLQAILSSPLLGLTKTDQEYKAPEDAPLTLLLVQNHGGEIIRIGKIEAIVLDAALSEEGLIVLRREDAISIVEAASIFAVERDRSAEQRERRRTGF
jgi:hypothetical protein